MIGYYMHQWVYESVTKKFNVCMYGVLLLLHALAPVVTGWVGYDL